MQTGLVQAGWDIAGPGYGDGCTDVPTLVKRHEAEMVFVQDKRDWDRNSPGCFNPAVHFENVGYLAERPDIFKVAPVKDAGTSKEYQRAFCEEIGANAVVTYYHDESILCLSPWLEKYPRIRTYHSIDAKACRAAFELNQPRNRGIVTGATSDVYPIRTMAFDHCDVLDISGGRHPGYGNTGCATGEYLELVARFRTHLATASRWGFCLRKIIESVAVGTTPVTNLPAYDKLPFIDDALVRISNDPSLQEIKDAIDRAEAEWNLDRAIYFAERAWSFYDYRAQGRRMSERLMELANTKG